MPFIDDELLWCPDNDGRMVDISANPQGQEITGNTCDLSELDPLCNDSEEILRQLAEHPFELDSFFQEFNGVDVKVRITNNNKRKIKRKQKKGNEQKHQKLSKLMISDCKHH